MPDSWLHITATDAIKKESSGAFTFTVDRARYSMNDLNMVSTVKYTVHSTAVSDTVSASDFVGGTFPSGLVTFAPNETIKVITINVADDTLVEPDETFTVDLTSPLNGVIGTPSAMGVILNDDTAPASPTIITGTGSITGTTGNDSITGSTGNDTITGGGGNDTIDGGGGTNSVIYVGNLANVVITKTGTVVIVKDNTGVNGTDTLKNVHLLQFDDTIVNLIIQSQAAVTNISAASLKIIEELYVGFFKRIPDANGLSYWIDQFKAGQTITHIADLFYTAGIQYSTTTGYTSTMTDSDFIKLVYANVLGRSGTTAPNATEIAFWNNKLLAGTETHGSIVKTMIDVVHNQYTNDATWGWVAKLLDNKATVANQVAVIWGINYPTAAESITKGVAIADAVTPTDTTHALSLVGVNTVFSP
jgi:hypothetical protein